MNNRKTARNRVIVIFFLIGLAMMGFILRAGCLVVNNGDEYYRKALAQATGSGRTILAQPGSIVDVNGTVLASAKKVYRLILDPAVIYETEERYPGSFEKTADITAEAFSLDKDAIKKAFSENASLSYVRFDRDQVLSEEQVAAFNEAVAAFDAMKKENNSREDAEKITARIAGVWFEEEYRRDYPLHDVLSKVIGYTTEDSREGIIGLEKQYNELLRGTDGWLYNYIDSEGNVTSEVVEAKDGCTLETSLDANVAEILKSCIDEFRQETGGKRVNILVMNPQTAEIIAMESDTEFDLNDPSDISGLFTEAELQNPKETFLLQEAFKGRKDALEALSYEEALEALKQQVQINYQVSGTFEPGSTSKAITISAGIEEGIVTPDEKYYCDGQVQVDRYTIHCHMDTLCGELTPMEALARSCNVCLVRMGLKIGAPTFCKYQELYNLGQKTGIDLPGEANTSKLIYYEDNMHEVELSTCSFGQGYNVTMIQMAAAYASMLNGGYYYEPHIVTRIVDSYGNTVKDIEPVLVRRTISEETSDYMREALSYVTERGTGTFVVTDGYSLGGKTGAAEKLPRGDGRYTVSFIGATPMDDPKILIYVTVEEPYVEDQSISLPAVLLTKNCMEKLYAYFGIYPETDDDAYAYDWSVFKDSSADSDAAHGEADMITEDGQSFTPLLPEDGAAEETTLFPSEGTETVPAEVTETVAPAAP